MWLEVLTPKTCRGRARGAHLPSFLELVLMLRLDGCSPSQVASGRARIAHSQVLADSVGEV